MFGSVHKAAGAMGGASLTRIDIVCRAFVALRERYGIERLRANMLLADKGVDKRAVRVPLALMSEDGKRVLVAFECRVSASRYRTARVKRMRRLARAPVVEIAGEEQAALAADAVPVVTEDWQA